MLANDAALEAEGFDVRGLDAAGLALRWQRAERECGAVPMGDDELERLVAKMRVMFERLGEPMEGAGR